MKRTIFAPVAALLSAVALLAVLVGTQPTHYARAGATTTCADSGTLQAILNAAPANSTITLTAGACFTVNGSLRINGTTGLTVNGNGVTFTQAANPPGVTVPLFFLTANRNLTLENFSAVGAYNGTNGGVAYEGSYGILAEANHGLKIGPNVSISNVQGDFMNLETDYAGGTGDLNTSVMVTGDHFTNAGYHGITIEATDGATFSHDVFTGMGPDAIDLESDIYSTNIAVGEGRYRAENNVDIRSNTFSGFTSDWFANIQPQVPGIQEHNVHLTGNTIDNASPLVEVVGPAMAQTTGPYFLSGLTIQGNTGLQGATSTHGGSITVPFVGSAMTIANAVAVTVSGNTLPLFDGTCDPPATYTYYCNTPYLAAAQINNVAYGNVKGNTFSGALGVLHPDTGQNAYVGACGNRFGINGGLIDNVC